MLTGLLLISLFNKSFEEHYFFPNGKTNRRNLSSVQPSTHSVNTLESKAPLLIYSTLSHTYQIICQKIRKESKELG